MRSASATCCRVQRKYRPSSARWLLSCSWYISVALKLFLEILTAYSTTGPLLVPCRSLSSHIHPLIFARIRNGDTICALHLLVRENSSVMGGTSLKPPLSKPILLSSNYVIQCDDGDSKLSTMCSAPSCYLAMAGLPSHSGLMRHDGGLDKMELEIKLHGSPFIIQYVSEEDTGGWFETLWTANADDFQTKDVAKLPGIT